MTASIFASAITNIDATKVVAFPRSMGVTVDKYATEEYSRGGC